MYPFWPFYHINCFLYTALFGYFVYNACVREFESRLKWTFSNFPHHLWPMLSDYRGMAKWFRAHYNQEVRISPAVKCMKGLEVLTSLLNQRRNNYYQCVNCADRPKKPHRIWIWNRKSRPKNRYLVEYQRISCGTIHFTFSHGRGKRNLGGCYATTTPGSGDWAHDAKVKNSPVCKVTRHVSITRKETYQPRKGSGSGSS